MIGHGSRPGCLQARSGPWSIDPWVRGNDGFERKERSFAVRFLAHAVFQPLDPAAVGRRVPAGSHRPRALGRQNPRQAGDKGGMR